MAFTYELPALADAFNNYIDTDIPGATSAVRACEDYTTHGNSWNQYPEIRAMTTVINWKSNVGGSDSVHNFRVKLTTDIHRGDIIYDANTGKIGMITYYVDTMPDCKRTQVSECNVIVSIYRDVPETLNPRTGEVVSEAGAQALIENIPGFYSSMYGRYNYETGNNTPGIFPDQKIELKIQWNGATQNIKSGDWFLIRDVKHRIMVTTYDYLDIGEGHGFINLICERVE